MRRRVFVVAGEYSANPRHLSRERRQRDFFSHPLPELPREEVTRLFFRFPNRSDDGRTRPEDWQRDFSISEPVGLNDLFASAAHRALSSLHALLGGDYRRTRDSLTDLFVTSMPGLEPNERMNIGLVAPALRAVLGLSPRLRAQYVVGTSDSGAWAFAQAVRTARNAERPATILVLAGQIIPAGYVSQYQIRSVLGEDDQMRGLDMLAVGDLLMDAIRRNLGHRREELEAFLARVSQRKLQAGAHYPAGIQSGKPFRREARRTPYFDASDIAVPCCGAAATIVTSDEDLALAVSATSSPRYRTAPVMEVLGVGEGSSNQNMLQRKSPLIFATAIREAFADLADDAQVPISTFVSCAFGVAHDAFPSIELSFLLGLGLGWERSAERMAEGWSNPVGGLLSFGHALGASGLVQVNKAHHLFCVDQRYLAELPGRKRQGFREDGALAFTTSVGGPLSHIVTGLFRGGYQEMRAVRQRSGRGEPEGAPSSRLWREKRHHLRLVLPAYLRGMRGAWLIEGTTWVSIRSCLRALTPADVARLTFPGIEELVQADKLPELRQRLRSVVAIVQQESERLASMFDVFRLLTDEVREIVSVYRQRGGLLPQAAALGEERVADRLKESLRVPFVVLCRPTAQDAGREVRFLPLGEMTSAALDEVELVSADTLQPLPAQPTELPFWNIRAQRSAQGSRAGGSLRQVIESAVENGPRSAGELALLRLWFMPDPPRPLLERALLDAEGVAPEPPTPVRALFYLGEVVDCGKELTAAEAHELLGRAAREARAYLEAYESSIGQIGPLLLAIAFERPPYRTGLDEALQSAGRFAQEVARSALEHGVVVRAAACAGEGQIFEDAAGRPAVVSPAASRVHELLAAARAAAPGRPAFVLEGASSLLASLLGQRLAGWEKAPDVPGGAALWIGP